MHISKITLFGLFITGIFLFSGCTHVDHREDIKTESQQELSIEKVKFNNLLRDSLETLEGGEVIVSIVELPPDTVMPRHYHPGEEFIYLMEGSASLLQKNKPEIPLTKGDVIKVPYKQIHTARTEKEGVRAIIFRVHQKGEPERVMVDE